MTDKTLYGSKLSVYVLIEILKYCMGSSAKSYECKHAIHKSLTENIFPPEKVGQKLREVITFHTLRGKFSSVHPELREEGIVKVEVGDEGIHFIRNSGFNFLKTTKSNIIACIHPDESPSSSTAAEDQDQGNEDELIKQAIALSLEV